MVAKGCKGTNRRRPAVREIPSAVRSSEKEQSSLCEVATIEDADTVLLTSFYRSRSKESGLPGRESAFQVLCFSSEDGVRAGHLLRRQFLRSARRQLNSFRRQAVFIQGHPVIRKV